MSDMIIDTLIILFIGILIGFVGGYLLAKGENNGQA